MTWNLLVYLEVTYIIEIYRNSNKANIDSSQRIVGNLV